MGIFKKKPKPDIMGYICYETSMNRAHFFTETFQDEHLELPFYLISTAIIFHNLKEKYSDAVIDECQYHCDRFYMKKHKDVSLDEMIRQREEITCTIENATYVEAFLKNKEIEDKNGLVSYNLNQWMEARLLLDDSIKSM